MSELQRFLPDDQELLVSLFYRVGQWMSSVDDTDTTQDSEQVEESQMIRILTKLSDSKSIGALCSEIAAESLRQKGSWSRWSREADEVIDDIHRAKSMMKGQATHDEFVAFGKSLVTIATAVARAYRESDDAEFAEKGFLSWLAEKKAHVTLALTDSESYKELNISPAEDSALTELIFVLKN